MTCTPVTLPAGGHAIVCGSSARCRCGRRAPLLCDWKVPERRSGTCDTPVCERCTTSPTAGKDLCPTHAAAWADWLAERRSVNG